MKLHSRHIRTSIFILTILILLVSSCTSSTEKPKQPVATTVPSATLPVATITPVSLPTIQPTPEIKLEEGCMTLEDKLPSNLHLSGVWIRQRANPYLENLEDHTKYRVPLQGGGVLDNMAISSDSKLLAYLDRYVNSSGKGTDRWEFRILKPNGHLMVLQNWIFDVRGILGWASNTEIVLKVFSTGIKYVVYNPFTGKSREIIIDSNIVHNSYEDEIVSKFGKGDYFNPNKIIFQTIDGNFLFDMQSWKNLLNIDIGYSAEYSWSPDLSSIIIIPYIDGNKEDLYVIKDNEIIAQLNINKTGLATDKYEWINGHSWSPDSKKFIMSSWSKVAIFNLETLKLMRVCINGDSEFEVNTYSDIWSPDSRFLIFQYIQHNPNRNYNVFIDTESMRAFKLPISNPNEDQIGWLASP